LSVPFDAGTNEIAMSASIGIAVARGTAKDARAIVTEADEAMYQAKQHRNSGGGRSVWRLASGQTEDAGGPLVRATARDPG
jgi:GGDEF domain-containing protein